MEGTAQAPCETVEAQEERAPGNRGIMDHTEYVLRHHLHNVQAIDIIDWPANHTTLTDGAGHALGMGTQG